MDDDATTTGPRWGEPPLLTIGVLLEKPTNDEKQTNPMML
jgi:hypothetical protein